MSYAIADMKPTIHNAIKIDPIPLKLNSSAPLCFPIDKKWIQKIKPTV